jgi:diguanylate cyclase (GGDEF)-like protein
LQTRFRVGVGIMLLPLVNLGASGWFSLSQVDRAVHELVAGPPTGWGEQLAVIAGTRREALTVAVAVFLGSVLVAAVAGHLLARSVLRPLAAIRHGAESWGRGELAHRVRLERGDELGQVATAFDAMAGALQRSQETLAHGAGHDPLTDLPNRRLLLTRLADAPAAQQARALLLVDLDGFKTVNDSLGHTAGDRVLVEMARRLQATVGDDGVCARLGGDEFAVLVPCPGGPVHAQEIAEQLRQVIRHPVTVDDRDIVLDASIGIVPDVATRAGDTESLLRDADLAMYAGKHAGGGRAELFVPALHERAVARLEMEAELRQALRCGQIRPYFQPVTDVVTGQVVGLEALARWEHPRRGLLMPGTFIPIAEDSSLIVSLGQQLLEQACAEVAQWQRENPTASGLRLSVNLSARQLAEPALPDHLRRALQSSGLAPECLTLEITETVMMHDAETVLERLRALVDQGVSLAVDDFGTGYSSLAYLQRFPIDTLKVDRSFVAPLGTDPDAAVLTGAVLRLAETLGLRVIAEGVENHDQLAVLRGLGCPLVQGFLVGRPAPLRHLALPRPATSTTAELLLTQAVPA